MYDAILIEERNKPTVTLYMKNFKNVVGTAVSSKQMPVLRMLPTNVPCEATVMSEIEAGVDEVMEDIIRALTKPLTAEEKSPTKPKAVEKPPRIIFQGDLEEVNRFFFRSGWGDGLPIIPPTEEKVAEMLTGTDLPADHVVGKLDPMSGNATVEKIAINAVMAGALPTYMPVLIAAIKIISDSTNSGFGGWAGSTGSWAPFWVINGPIRNDLNINSGSGALSPGNIANATIGRAMQLIIRNIAGVRKGIEDMGVQGNPGKYSLVLAENEEESPWEPLHVELGFKREDSIVSVSSPNCYIQTVPFSNDDGGILRSICSKITGGAWSGIGIIITMNPGTARMLSERGWTKKDIKEFISRYVYVPAHEMGSYWGTSNPGDPPEGGARLYKNRIVAKEFDNVQLIGNPESITIIVAGGQGAFIGIHSPSAFYASRKAIEKISLPANWAKLVKKYKDIVPTYVRY